MPAFKTGDIVRIKGHEDIQFTYDFRRAVGGAAVCEANGLEFILPEDVLEAVPLGCLRLPATNDSSPVALEMRNNNFVRLRVNEAVRVLTTGEAVKLRDWLSRFIDLSKRSG